MSEQKVEFSGTLQNTVSETTQNKFTGTGKIIGPPSRAARIIVITLILTIPLVVAMTLFNIDTMVDFFKNFRINTSEGLSIRTPSAAPSKSIVANEVKEPVEEHQSMSSRDLSINGYLVIIAVLDNPQETKGFEQLLRQKRINAKSRFFESKYYIYVGPLSTKRLAESALRNVLGVGYSNAYVLPPI